MPIEAAGSIYIDRPPKEVFALLTDLGRLHEWLVGCSKAFPVKGPPNKVGSIVGHNNDLLGRAFESRYEITKWEPPKSISSNAIKGPFSGVSEEEFQEQDGGTLFSARVAGNLRGPFRALDRAARRVAQSQLDTSLRNAKGFAESTLPTSNH